MSVTSDYYACRLYLHFPAVHSLIETLSECLRLRTAMPAVCNCHTFIYTTNNVWRISLTPDLPLVESPWMKTNAFFKVEGNQVNIGLGLGNALKIFNSNIQSFKKL